MTEDSFIFKNEALAHRSIKASKAKIQCPRSNWRPITLQNSVYKLLSADLANRLNLVLPSIINKDQSGFVNGR